MLISRSIPLHNNFSGYYYDTSRCDEVIEEDDAVFLFHGWLYKDLDLTPRDLYARLRTTHDISQFKGVFCGALIMNNDVTVFTDRLGLGDVFVQEDPLIVSDRFTEFFRIAEYTMDDLDPVGVAEFVMFEHCIKSRTFIESIRLLPCGTVQTIGKEPYQYWDYAFSPKVRPNRKEAFEELDGLFNHAITRIRMENPDGVFGIGLSGGLDSRITAKYLKDRGANVTTFVFDHNNSDAARVSAKLARVMGLPLKRLVIPDDFSSVLDAHMEYDPMYSVRNAAYCTIRDQLPQCDAMVTGFFGDTGFGSHIKAAELTNDGDLAPKLRKRLDVVKTQLAEDDVVAQVDADLASYDIGKPHWQCAERSEIDNRQHRFVKNSPSFHFYGRYLPTYSMFSDLDVVEFILSLPVEELYENNFYHSFIRYRFPRLARIRSERRAYSLMDPSWARHAKTFALKVKYKIHEKTGVTLPIFRTIGYRDAFDFERIYEVNKPHVSRELHAPGLRIDAIRALTGLRGNQVKYNYYTVGLFAERYLHDAQGYSV